MATKGSTSASNAVAVKMHGMAMAMAMESGIAPMCAAPSPVAVAFV